MENFNNPDSLQAAISKGFNSLCVLAVSLNPLKPPTNPPTMPVCMLENSFGYLVRSQTQSVALSAPYLAKFYGNSALCPFNNQELMS